LAKSKRFLPSTLPSIPSLTTPQDPATTLKAKCDTLNAHFLLLTHYAELLDIPEFQYPAEKLSIISIILEKILSALIKARPFKAQGLNRIPMYFPKSLGRPLLEYL
jgi:hypothetical protein